MGVQRPLNDPLPAPDSLARTVADDAKVADPTELPVTPDTEAAKDSLADPDDDKETLADFDADPDPEGVAWSLAEGTEEGEPPELPVTLPHADPETLQEGTKLAEAPKDSLTDPVEDLDAEPEPEGVATPLAESAEEGEPPELPVTLVLTDSEDRKDSLADSVPELVAPMLADATSEGDPPELPVTQALELPDVLKDPLADPETLAEPDTLTDPEALVDPLTTPVADKLLADVLEPVAAPVPVTQTEEDRLVTGERVPEPLTLGEKEGRGERLVVTVPLTLREGDDTPEAVVDPEPVPESDAKALPETEIDALADLLAELLGVCDSVHHEDVDAVPLADDHKDDDTVSVFVLNHVIDVVLVNTNVEVLDELRAADKVLQPLPVTEPLLERKGDAEAVPDLEEDADIVPVRLPTTLFDTAPEPEPHAEVVLVLLEEEELVRDTVADAVLDALVDTVPFVVPDTEAVVLELPVTTGVRLPTADKEGEPLVVRVAGTLIAPVAETERVQETFGLPLVVPEPDMVLLADTERVLAALPVTVCVFIMLFVLVGVIRDVFVFIATVADCVALLVPVLEDDAERLPDLVGPAPVPEGTAVADALFVTAGDLDADTVADAVFVAAPERVTELLADVVLLRVIEVVPVPDPLDVFVMPVDSEIVAEPVEDLDEDAERETLEEPEDDFDCVIEDVVVGVAECVLVGGADLVVVRVCPADLVAAEEGVGVTVTRAVGVRAAVAVDDLDFVAEGVDPWLLKDVGVVREESEMYQVAKEDLELVVVFVDVLDVVGLCVVRMPPPSPSVGPSKAAKNMNAVNNPIAFFYQGTT